MKTMVVRGTKHEAAEVTKAEDGRPVVITRDGVTATGDTIFEAADRVTARLRGN